MIGRGGNQRGASRATFQRGDQRALPIEMQGAFDAMCARSRKATAQMLRVGIPVVDRLRYGGHASADVVARVVDAMCAHGFGGGR